MPELDIKNLKDHELVKLIDNRWKESESLSKVIQNTWKLNKPIWLNYPEWVARTPRKKSKARDNRTFLAMESQINTLLGRPSKPNVIPAAEGEESFQIADDLQDFFLAKYRDLGVKRKMRKGIRYLHLCRQICLKVFWDQEIDDFNVCTKDPRKIRFSKHATSGFDTKFAIEEVDDKTVQDLVDMFPEKKADILKKAGTTESQLIIDNPEAVYFEVWIGGYLIFKYKDQILSREPHPYWDWDGLQLTANEYTKFKKAPLKDRQEQIKGYLDVQGTRKESKTKYEQYLYNHFDKPIPPYIFGTVLDIEDKPVGDTSLIEQVAPLQIEIDKRKRQISENADKANGMIKIDTNFAKISKEEAQAAKADPSGMWYGKGVKQGVTMETGRDLPALVKEDLLHSIVELDNIFGTGNTFRGEQGTKETAAGRAILREASFQRLDEMIDLIDTIHYQLYNWWFQMIKVRYTDSHFVKPIGANKARRVIELSRNDLEDGIEIKIIPGQILPEDRLFRAERAAEEMKNGIIDPLTYFEETQRENPQELAKRLLMFKTNPLSIVSFTDEEIAKLQQANAMMSALQSPQGGVEGDGRPQQLAELRQKAQQVTESAEFQALPPEEQQAALKQIQEQMAQLTNQ